VVLHYKRRFACFCFVKKHNENIINAKRAFRYDVLHKTDLRYFFQSHQRMVSSVAWGEEVSEKGYSLFTAGFDRKVLGWQIMFTKESVAHGKQ
jgi:WD40 repeat protein